MIIPFTNMIPPKMAVTIATYGVYELKFISAHVWDKVPMPTSLPEY
jgi:hypothetical protein